MADDNRSSLPYCAFGAIIAFLAGVLALILRSRRYPAYGVRLPNIPEVTTYAPDSAIILPDTLPSGTLPAPDDLTVIEGIGLKVQATLNAAGIYRLDQLAKTATDELLRILRAAGNRISDPTTWAEQASMAAAAKWDELKALQAQLKGGRRG